MHKRPLMTGAAAFAAGICAGTLGWLTLWTALCLAAAGISVLLTRKWPALFPAGLLLLGASAGALRLASFEAVAPSDISRLADGPRPVQVVGTIASDPEPRPGGRLTFFFDPTQISARAGTASVTGEVSVTIGPYASPSLALDYGDRIRLEGLLVTPEPATNPGAFSWRNYLARRAIYSELKVKRPGAATVMGTGGANLFLTSAWQCRKTAISVLQSSLPPTEAAVLSGILIGRRSDLPPSLMADFVHTGTVHILASAGLHVGILAFWLERLFRTLTLPRKLQALLLMTCLLLYALVCGGRPAVVRAVLMAALYFGAILFEREPDGPTAVSAAGLLILLLQPTALLEPGFQMSFLTILTLSLTMPLWNSFWRPKLSVIRRPQVHHAAQWVLDGIGLSLLAQLGAMPITALSYSEVSLTGWAANLVVVPTLFVLVPIGFIGIGLGAVSHGLGVVCLSAAGWGIDVISRVVRGLGEAPWAYFALSPPPLPLVLAFYAALYGGTDYGRVNDRWTNDGWTNDGQSSGTFGIARKDLAPEAPAPGAAGPGTAGLVGTVPPP